MNVSEKVDWLSVTFPSNTKLSEIIPRGCGIKRAKSPIPVYDECFETEPFKIKVMYSKYERLGIHAIYSGKPLTELYIDGYSIQSIYDNIKRLGGKIGRIDLAIDVIGSHVVVEDFEMRAYDRVCTLNGSTGIFTDKNSVETLYLGNPKSTDQKLRIYNKGVEQAVDYRWVRVEYEKRKRADNLARKLLGEHTHTLRGIIKSVLNFPNWQEYQEIINCEATPILRSTEKKKDDEYGQKLHWLTSSVAPTLAKLMIDDWIIDGADLHDTLSFETFVSSLNAELIKRKNEHISKRS